MSTSKDAARVAAFRRWYREVARDMESARALTAIGDRTLQRLVAGKQPPPARLLDQLADGLLDQALADQLRDAARPEVPHA